MWRRVIGVADAARKKPPYLKVVVKGEAGDPRLELGLTEPETVVLPITPIPCIG